MSLPARGEWIEMEEAGKLDASIASLPARGEWIEIHHVDKTLQGNQVSPRTGRVD